jgi:hypothetical protein
MKTRMSHSHPEGMPRASRLEAGRAVETMQAW